ncbi:MAG: hypothetical protein LLG37_11255 [Spirochaetia bacterium]|nr:hypothetical protein [Spirochaetia bacterium]
MICIRPGDYEYWKNLRRDSLKAYTAAKKKFPGFKSGVEQADLATPDIYERYTAVEKPLLRAGRRH